jgi:hypothetical protein
MVFVVEMAWGRPTNVIVETTNDDGDPASQVIETGEPPDPEWRFFSCGGGVWSSTLELGKANGWLPAGALPSPGSFWKKDLFEASYQPTDWGYAKMMAGPDASNLADALERFLDGGSPVQTKEPAPVLLREAMTAEELEAANRSASAGFLREFIAFLRKGPFSFAWDD